jgi:large subunit ribosomal protein L4
MELTFVNSNKKLKVADEVFGCDFNESLVHQVVTAYLAASRAGTKAQKTRAEVRGGGAKPFRQKGTGQARAGTIRSPLWRKGGIIFAAKPRSYAQKVNKKMYKGALRSIFSELVRQNRLTIIDAFQVDAPKTKALVSKLSELKLQGNVLIVPDNIDENLYLAARNLTHVEIKDQVALSADPVSLVKADYVVMTPTTIKEIEELLK